MIKRTLAAALFLLSSFCVLIASQGNLVLPTTGVFTGVEFSNLITEAQLANASCHSGTTAPTNATGGAAVAGQCWHDTSTSPVTIKIYDGASWVSRGRLDTTNHLWLPVDGGGVVSVASASTVDLCAVPQTYIILTGGTTINSFGTGACQVGQTKVIRFQSATTVNYNASTLVLPNSENLTTQANEIGIAVRATSTRWDILMPRTPGVSSAPAAVIDVPIAGMIPYAGFDVPSADFEFCAGQGIDRSANPDYVTAVTKAYASIGRTNGGLTLTGFANTEQLRPGMDIEGTGIATGAQIASKTGATVVMTAGATSGGTGTVTFFAHGNGNGTSTVNVPDTRGRVFAGRDNMGGTAASRLTSASPTSCSGDGLGASCGNQEGTLTTSQLPDFTKTVQFNNANFSGSGTIASGSTITSGGASVSMNHTHTVSITIPTEGANIADPSGKVLMTDDHADSVPGVSFEDVSTAANLAHTHNTNISGTAVNVSGTLTGTQALTFGSDAAHTRVQPTFVSNCIIRVK